MKRYRHYPSLGCTFRVQGVELIAHHLIPVLGSMAALEDHADIIQPLLVRNADHTARLDSHRDWLIVATPIADVVETFGGQMIERVRALVASARAKPTAWRFTR